MPQPGIQPSQIRLRHPKCKPILLEGLNLGKKWILLPITTLKSSNLRNLKMLKSQTRWCEKVRRKFLVKSKLTLPQWLRAKTQICNLKLRTKNLKKKEILETFKLRWTQGNIRMWKFTNVDSAKRNTKVTLESTSISKSTTQMRLLLNPRNLN